MSIVPMGPRRLGATGLVVPVLGLGAGQLGDAALDEARVERVLGRALDLGLGLVDAARSYGLAEERIGKYLAHRRREYVLVTKVGYGIPGFDDWTGPCVAAGIDAALGKLRTDVLDVVLFHSCPRAVLERGDCIRALEDAVKLGKVRFGGYSGENSDLEYAITSGPWCSVIETSVNLWDQRGLDESIPRARARGIGVIAKRPLGNAPWRHSERPVGTYVEEYWARREVMAVELRDLAPDEHALRFAAWAPGVDVAIAGTASEHNLDRLAQLVMKGPLEATMVGEARARFRACDRGWHGQI
ncbi:aldo/keto reductase [Myxococcota bacterium]|nr:aldo/keto reductase [Myxococcota bacterium]